jgi:methionine synthase I (cobalamin-dependent)
MEIRFPLILDGATGTQLQKRGYMGDMSAEQWVLENPESIIEIQKSYVEAGSNVLYSPSFGANRRKLEEHGIFNKTAEYNRRLAQLSQKAADGRAWVAGDISPTGMFLSPLGEASFEELVDIYTEQAAGLEEAGVDLFVIETMMTLSDARAAVLAVRSVSDKPIFVTFTCDENGRSLSGTDVAAALVVLQGMGISAFGLNCSAGPDQMLTQLQRLREFARVPLIAKPNAGMPQIVDGKTVYDCPPEEFAGYVQPMLEAGVAVFGGCCGTTAEHIAALRAALENAKFVRPAPQHSDMLPASTEKNTACLPVDAKHGRVLEVSGNLEDDISDELDSAEAMIAIHLAGWDDIDAFADCQYMISKPLCIICDDADVLESALRVYQGRALYEGPLAEAELLPLCGKYGLII